MIRSIVLSPDTTEMVDWALKPMTYLHTLRGERERGRHAEEEVGRQHQEWTGLESANSQRAVENRNRWRELVAKSSVVPQRSVRVTGKIRRSEDHLLAVNSESVNGGTVA